MALAVAQVDRAAALLEEARLARRTIPCIPEDVRPASLADAYTISDRLAERLGWEVAGWYCACTNGEIQRMLGLAEPYCARLFARALHRSPAVVRADSLPPMVLECEVGFTLSRDLPARAEPYTRAEVEDAIASVHPTIEIVAGHLERWTEQDVFSVIADNGTDGGLVVGEGVAGWRGLDLPALDVTLALDGEVVRRGSGANVLGDPLAAFVWLANARRAAGDGLRAGSVSNTGTATSICPVAAGQVAVADFGPLGRVRLEVV